MIDTELLKYVGPEDRAVNSFLVQNGINPALVSVNGFGYSGYYEFCVKEDGGRLYVDLGDGHKVPKLIHHEWSDAATARDAELAVIADQERAMNTAWYKRDHAVE